MPGYELFGDEERKHINDVIESGILMRYGFENVRKAWKAKEMEQALCQTLQCNYAQLTSSGTTALTTALAALGVGYGDEVIVPVFTFVASFEAILGLGAIPVFADIDETLTLSPQAVEKAIGPKTKCIMPVHMCGSMAQIDSLLQIASAHSIDLLEDACQSFGASFKGKKAGTIGKIGAFSFDFAKTITCGEGGAIVTNSQALYEKCAAFADHGHDHLGADRGADNHPFMGANFRISELQAAIGLAQIQKIENFIAIQKKNYSILQEIISEIPQVSFRKLPDPDGNSYTFLSWFLPEASLTQKVISLLKEENALAGNFYWYNNNWHYIHHWQHLKHTQSLYRLNPLQEEALQKLKEQTFTNSDTIMSRCISTAIPLSWTEQQAVQKAQTLKSAIQKALQKHS